MNISQYLNKKSNIWHLASVTALGAVLAVSFPAASLYADASSTQEVVKDLQSQILDRNQHIQQLQTEISQYQTQVTQVGKQANTLQNAVKSLDASGKQLETETKLTTTNIDKAQLTIEQLGIEMNTKEKEIDTTNDAIAETIRTMDKADSNSVIEILLTQPDLESAWNDIAVFDALNNKLSGHVTELKGAEADLENQQQLTAAQKKELADYQETLSDKKQLVEINKQQKATLLAQTKDQESKYKTLLAQKEAEEEQFQQELRDLESKLQFTLNPSTIPIAGTAVFHWPLDSVRITQYFGNTAFAQTAAYNGQGHNGIDIAAAIGTPVKAALDGTVIGVNSQVAPMCQYGKWVLIRHPNGLTSLYAHLSLVKVTQGAQVATGDVIGYSGDTGYATGPHLHFTVYASAAVKLEQYTCNSGITLTIPIAAFSGYLDPMKYLPPA